MDDSRYNNPTPSLKPNISEQIRSRDQKPTDAKGLHAVNHPSKDTVQKTRSTLRQPFLPARSSLQEEEEKLPDVPSNPISSTQPALVEKEAKAELSPEGSKVDNEKPNVLRRGRFYGDRSKGVTYSKTVLPDLVESRFPKDFNFDEIEYMPNLSESPHDSPNLLSSILDDVPDPESKSEANRSPETLIKLDLDSDLPMAYSLEDCSPASPEVNGNSLPYDANLNKKLPHGYIFPLKPPYFNQASTLDILEEPLPEAL